MSLTNYKIIRIDDKDFKLELQINSQNEQDMKCTLQFSKEIDIVGFPSLTLSPVCVCDTTGGSVVTTIDVPYVVEEHEMDEPFFHEAHAKEQERLKILEEERSQQEQARIERIEKELLENERMEKERLEEERIIEEQRVLEEQRLEEERILEEQRLEEERLEEQRLEEQRLEEERILEEQRLEEERLEEERLEEQRLEEERLEEQRLEEERLLDEEKERLMEEQRIAEENERVGDSENKLINDILNKFNKHIEVIMIKLDALEKKSLEETVPKKIHHAPKIELVEEDNLRLSEIRSYLNLQPEDKPKPHPPPPENKPKPHPPPPENKPKPHPPPEDKPKPHHAPPLNSKITEIQKIYAFDSEIDTKLVKVIIDHMRCIEQYDITGPEKKSIVLDSIETILRNNETSKKEMDLILNLSSQLIDTFIAFDKDKINIKEKASALACFACH